MRNSRQKLNELNIEGFDFNNGFKCSDMHVIEKLYNLCINIFELIFYPGQNIWKHNLTSVEISENDLYINLDLIKYKNHHALKKNTCFFSKSLKNLYM